MAHEDLLWTIDTNADVQILLKAMVHPAIQVTRIPGAHP